MENNFKIGYVKELRNRKLKGTFKSKCKSHFTNRNLKSNLEIGMCKEL